MLVGSGVLRPGRDAKPSGNQLSGSSFDIHCKHTKSTSFFFFLHAAEASS